jgi:hypothetical protein
LTSSATANRPSPTLDEQTSKSGTFYYPKIRYDYVILGTRYENDTIEFDQRSFDHRDEAAQVTARYPVGARVDVHYDPDDPQQSCLQCLDDSASNAVRVALWSFVVPFILPLVRPAIEHVFDR